MKRRLLLVSVASAAIAVAAFGGVVLAQEGTAEEGETKGIFGRAADILGIGEDELKGAFEQAGAEIRDERQDAHLDKLVEDGVLTEEEAADLREWLDARPEVLDNLSGVDGRSLLPRGPGGEFGRRFGPHFHFRAPRAEGGLLPPDIEVFEEFKGLRGERGFGIIDGKGFRFFWSGPADGGDDEPVDEPVAGEGVSL